MSRSPRLGVAALLALLGGCSGEPAAPAVPPLPEPEADQATQRLADLILARADTDGNGVLSEEEYAPVAFPDEPLSMYDRDQDQRLSRAEVLTLLLEVDPARLQHTRRQPAPTQDGGGKAGKRGKAGKVGKAGPR